MREWFVNEGEGASERFAGGRADPTPLWRTVCTRRCSSGGDGDGDGHIALVDDFDVTHALQCIGPLLAVADGATPALAHERPDDVAAVRVGD